MWFVLIAFKCINLISYYPYCKAFLEDSKIFSAFKAKKIGLLNDCFLTRKRLYKKSYELAKQIASLPPHAVQGTKTTINYARDHTVAEGLEQIAQMNSVLLNSPTMNEELSKIDSILNR